MNKTLIASALSLMIACTCGCSNGKAGREVPKEETSAINDSANTTKPSAETKAAVVSPDDEKQMEELARLLVSTDPVDFASDNYALLKKLCTDKALRKLHDDYDYEYEPGTEIYCTWAFGCDCQDSGKTSVVGIEWTGKNTLTVTGKDEAHEGTFQHVFTFTNEDGTWKLDDYQ